VNKALGKGMAPVRDPARCAAHAQRPTRTHGDGPVEPWPHQAVVARRLIESWPYRFLFCDEVEGVHLTPT
jgi:hypothetical protein